MRVAVTGAAGFIGAAIVALLEESGHEVVPVDLLIPQAHGIRPQDGRPVGAHPELQIIDVRDRARIGSAFRGVDVVCHQAALVGAGLTVSDFPEYASHNDLGTATVLAAMTDVGVRHLVMASSMVVYGEGRYRCTQHGPQQPGPRQREALDRGAFDNLCVRCQRPLEWTVVEETSRFDPRSAYAVSKAAQEQYAAVWVRQAQAASISLRYHNVYGPGMPRDTPYSGVAAMFRSALERGESPRVFEDGAQMRDFVHVADVARANLLAIEQVVGRQDARAFNVCSGRPISIAEVAELIASASPAAVRPTVTGEYRLGDVRHIVASPAMAARELGFVAEIDPRRGLREFASAPLREPALL